MCFVHGSHPTTPCSPDRTWDSHTFACPSIPPHVRPCVGIDLHGCVTMGWTAWGGGSTPTPACPTSGTPGNPVDLPLRTDRYVSIAPSEGRLPRRVKKARAHPRDPCASLVHRPACRCLRIRDARHASPRRRPRPAASCYRGGRFRSFGSIPF